MLLMFNITWRSCQRKPRVEILLIFRHRTIPSIAVVLLSVLSVLFSTINFTFVPNNQRQSLQVYGTSRGYQVPKQCEGVISISRLAAHLGGPHDYCFVVPFGFVLTILKLIYFCRDLQIPQHSTVNFRDKRSTFSLYPCKALAHAPSAKCFITTIHYASAS